MNKLVVGNILYRPVRSAISVFAVAIEVIMILSIVAIMMGQVTNAARQTSGIGADIMVQPPNASVFTAMNGAPVPASIAGVLAKMPHVAVASPVILNLSTTGSVQTIYGIEYDSFNALKPFAYLVGRRFQNPNDVIVDDLYARGHHSHVGDWIKIANFSGTYRICGIVEHGKGGRVFLERQVLGTLLGTPNNASIFYIRSDNPANEQAIIHEILANPNLATYHVETIAEWMSTMTPEHLPGFNTALHVVIGIAVIIGFLAIFQSMYTAVMERTREIGILKSLGASKAYIVNLVLREAVLVALCGIVLGTLLTQVIRLYMGAHFATTPFLISNQWRVQGAAIALAGSVLGALYPAWKAARKDPIDALAYE
ncbi:MAG TPA: FtsX-like permease family protein [Acidobacteriaceae bacterium]|jgi:putative ABC transport system permease protein|nr:FtsX-like permease family protein [Acidobacteriaceae bacterium]